MKQIVVNVPDNKLKFFLELLERIGFKKKTKNHYELVSSPKKKTKYNLDQDKFNIVSEPEFKGYENSISSFEEISTTKKSISKKQWISTKEIELVKKRIKSAKAKDFVSLEKFEKSMRKKLGYSK